MAGREEAMKTIAPSTLIETFARLVSCCCVQEMSIAAAIPPKLHQKVHLEACLLLLQFHYFIALMPSLW